MFTFVFHIPFVSALYVYNGKNSQSKLKSTEE